MCAFNVVFFLSKLLYCPPPPLPLSAYEPVHMSRARARKSYSSQVRVLRPQPRRDNVAPVLPKPHKVLADVGVQHRRRRLLRLREGHGPYALDRGTHARWGCGRRRARDRVSVRGVRRRGHLRPDNRRAPPPPRANMWHTTRTRVPLSHRTSYVAPCSGSGAAVSADDGGGSDDGDAARTASDAGAVALSSVPHAAPSRGRRQPTMTPRRWARVCCTTVPTVKRLASSRRRPCARPCGARGTCAGRGGQR